jgi:hypothetical protein
LVGRIGIVVIGVAGTLQLLYSPPTVLSATTASGTMVIRFSFATTAQHRSPLERSPLTHKQSYIQTRSCQTFNVLENGWKYDCDIRPFDFF